MTIRVDIHFEEEGDDREFKADLLSVPRVGEFISIGSLANLHRFEVKRVWHHHLDGLSGVTLYCRRLDEHEQARGPSKLEKELLEPFKAVSST